MTLKLPINDLEDWVRFFCKFGVGVAESLKDDGKFSLTDVMNFGGALSELPAAISGTGNVIPQFKDLDAVELDRLKTVVFEELSDVDGIEGKWIKVVEEAIKAVGPIVNIFLILKKD